MPAHLLDAELGFHAILGGKHRDAKVGQAVLAGPLREHVFGGADADRAVDDRRAAHRPRLDDGPERAPAG